jgi:hypothetical protein
MGGRDRFCLELDFHFGTLLRPQSSMVNVSFLHFPSNNPVTLVAS